MRQCESSAKHWLKCFFAVNVVECVGTMKQRKWNCIVKENHYVPKGDDPVICITPK